MREHCQFGNLLAVIARPHCVVGCLALCRRSRARRRRVPCIVSRQGLVALVRSPRAIGGLSATARADNVTAGFGARLSVAASVRCAVGERPAQTRRAQNFTPLLLSSHDCLIRIRRFPSVRQLPIDLAAAAGFALLSTLPQVHGSSAQAEQFVLLPVVVAWWLAVRACDARKLSNRLAAANQRAASRYFAALVLAGLLLGVAITIKQHALFLSLATAVYVGASQWHNTDTTQRRTARIVLALLALAIGAAIPVALMVAAIVAAEVWEKFWFWTVVVAGNYATETPWSEGASRLLTTSALVGKGAPLVFGLALCGFSALWWDSATRPRRWFLLVTLLAAAVAVAPGLHFRRHYFVLLLPSAALLFALAATALGRMLGANQPSRPQSAIALVIVAVALLATLWPNRAYYFELNPAEISRLTFGGNPFPEAPVIAQRIAARTTPDDTVLVLGSEPELLFYAGRRSATRYIYMYPLVERQPYARQMQEDMIAEVEAARPAYVVFVAISVSWTFNDDSDRHVLQWFDDYLEAHYELDGCVDVRDVESAYIWGPSARLSSTLERLVARLPAARMSPADLHLAARGMLAA